jgi:hypothetical protein
MMTIGLDLDIFMALISLIQTAPPLFFQDLFEFTQNNPIRGHLGINKSIQVSYKKKKVEAFTTCHTPQSHFISILLLF